MEQIPSPDIPPHEETAGEGAEKSIETLLGELRGYENMIHRFHDSTQGLWFLFMHQAEDPERTPDEKAAIRDRLHWLLKRIKAEKAK